MGQYRDACSYEIPSLRMGRNTNCNELSGAKHKLLEGYQQMYIIIYMYVYNPHVHREYSAMDNCLFVAFVFSQVV